MFVFWWFIFLVRLDWMWSGFFLNFVSCCERVIIVVVDLFVKWLVVLNWFKKFFEWYLVRLLYFFFELSDCFLICDWCDIVFVNWFGIGNFLYLMGICWGGFDGYLDLWFKYWSLNIFFENSFVFFGLLVFFEEFCLWFFCFFGDVSFCFFRVNLGLRDCLMN